MSASRTSTNAVAAPTSRRMVGALRQPKARPCTPLAALSPRTPTQLITASDPLSALGKDLGRRRFPEFNDQDASRLSVAQAAAAAISSPAADINLTQDNTSFAASGRAQIVAWVELECLSLEASMEDMLVSMGSADFCSDLGNGMEYP